jgi:hypothetical protein
MRAVEVFREIVDMTREIDAARTRVHRGQAVDLLGLDGRVRDLCLSATELPKAEGAACASALDGVSSALDRLAGALRMVERTAERTASP